MLFRNTVKLFVIVKITLLIFMNIMDSDVCNSPDETFFLAQTAIKKNSWDRCCQIMGLPMPLAMLPSYIKVLFQVCCSSYPASCCTPGKAVGDDPSTCFSTTCVEDLERVPDFCQCLSLSLTYRHTYRSNYPIFYLSFVFPSPPPEVCAKWVEDRCLEPNIWTWVQRQDTRNP